MSAGRPKKPRPVRYLGFTFHEPGMVRRIGAEVRRIRLERGLSLTTVAERADVSVGFLSQCEVGERRFTGSLLGVLADLFDVDVVDLVLAAGACTRCGGSGVEPRRERGESDDVLALLDLMALGFMARSSPRRPRP